MSGDAAPALFGDEAVAGDGIALSIEGVDNGGDLKVVILNPHIREAFLSAGFHSIFDLGQEENRRRSSTFPPAAGTYDERPRWHVSSSLPPRRPKRLRAAR